MGNLGKKWGESGLFGRANPLADAQLCANDQYYHALAHPFLRQGVSRSARDFFAQLGPLLASACAVFIALSLALATPAPLRGSTFLGPLRARFAGTSAPVAFALVVAVPLFVALALVTVWARYDRALSRRTQAALDAKLRLASSYRQYLTELARLTEPLAWMRLAAPTASADERGPAVLVALTMRHETQWDGAEPAAISDDASYLNVADATQPLGATRPLLRGGLDASLEAIDEYLRSGQTAESVTQALASALSGAIILCGSAGAGKTTLMRYAAHAQALAQLRRQQPGGRLPLYADLGWLEGGWTTLGPDMLESALAASVERIGGLDSADARGLAHALITEPALLLLDELDTLPSEQRERVVSSLATFLTQRKRLGAGNALAGGAAWSAQVVVGSRSHDAPLGDGSPSARFELWRLEPLAYPLGRLALMRGALAHRPTTAPLPADTSETVAPAPAADDEAERLLRALAMPQTERWLMQPLALTLVALAATDTPDAAPGRSLSDLHRAVAWSLLRARVPEWDERERRALLRMAEETALWLQIAGRRAFSPGSPALDQELWRLPETALALKRAGSESPSRVVATLSGLCEGGPSGQVSFSLVTLHAFLAGSALARRVASELPRPLTPDAFSTDALIPEVSGARLPRPLIPNTQPTAATPSDVLDSDRTRANSGQRTALDLAWANRASTRWSDTLIVMCGALCGSADTAAAGEDSSSLDRSDIAVAWLRALLGQRDDLETPEAVASLGLLLAAASLPELRGDPSGILVAAEIASRLHASLGKSAEASSPAALARLHQACIAVMADPVGRETLLDLLTAQLLGDNARATQQAAQTIGALGQAGSQVAPLLLSLLESTVDAPRAAVAQALGALGHAAGAETRPALLAALDDENRSVREAVVAALGAVGAVGVEPDDALVQALLARLSDRGGEVRAAAALALGKLGVKTEEAAEALRLALRDRQTRVAIAAASALGIVNVSASQVPALTEALTTTGWKERAALALGALGESATASLPTLLELSRSDALDMREMATRALAQIGPRRADVVTALVERLSDDAPECRRAAADALAQMDRASAGIVALALPALVAALCDVRGSVRWSACRALDALGATDDPASRAALFVLLDDPRGYVRAAAARALETLAGAEARALPARIAALSMTRDETFLLAVGALGALGPSAKSALPTLARQVDDPRWENRRAALRALRQIDPAHDTTTARAILATNDAEPLVRLEALMSLGAHNPRHDRQALEALQRRLSGDSEGAVRAAAARALGRMGPRASRALPLLVGALADPDDETRRAAALAIGAVQPELTHVTPLLIDILSEQEPGSRSATALALGALGPRAAPTLTNELLILLKDEFAVTRAAAAEALGHYGAQVGEPAPAALFQRLNDKDSEVRAAAAYALGQIGAHPAAGGYHAAELEEALLTRADDQRYVVRRAAVSALMALGPAVVTRALDRVLDLLTDDNPSTRDVALEALAALDHAGRAAALPMLTAWLGAEATDQREMAARALAAMRPTLDAADRDALCLLLTDADDATRAAAAHAVGALSATSFPEEIPAGLGLLLADTNWQARAATAAALGRFGARVSSVDRRALRETLADRDESVRQAATDALARVQPGEVKALVAELLAMVKTRRPTGAHAALAYRAESEVYAAMSRPTWTVVERVTSWLSAETCWATQLDAIALFGRWRYAPMEARRRLLQLCEDQGYPVIRRAARTALQSILTEVADLDQPASSRLANAWPRAITADAYPTISAPSAEPELREQVASVTEPDATVAVDDIATVDVAVDEVSTVEVASAPAADDTADDAAEVEDGSGALETALLERPPSVYSLLTRPIVSEPKEPAAPEASAAVTAPLEDTSSATDAPLRSVITATLPDMPSGDVVEAALDLASEPLDASPQVAP